MKASTKTLSVLGMLGSPFLLLEMYTYQNANTRLTGLYDLVYMIGWMCSITGLLRLRATGTKKWGRVVLYVQLLFLAIANIFNSWTMMQPNSDSGLYRALDMFWPISNVWMLVCGITVISSAGLQGWRRYTILLAGLWFPITLLTGMTAGKSPVTFYVSGLYCLAAWFLMGRAVFTADKKEEQHLELAL